MSSQDCFRVPILLVAVSQRVLFITVDLACGAGRSGAAIAAAPAKNNLAPLGGFSTQQVRLLSWAKGGKKWGRMISSGGCLVGESTVCTALLLSPLCTRSSTNSPECLSTARLWSAESRDKKKYWLKLDRRCNFFSQVLQIKSLSPGAVRFNGAYFILMSNLVSYHKCSAGQHRSEICFSLRFIVVLLLRLARVGLRVG